MKMLWLASSYPSKVHPFDGDFVQRHAQAVSLFCEVEVIHVVKDGKGIETNDVKEVVVRNGMLTERIIYYKPASVSVPLADRILSGLKYKRLSRAACKRYLKENGTPTCIHLHMAMKAGLTALWLKEKYGIGYILTEHWGGYLPEAKPNISDYNAVYHHYWKRIIQGARASTFVSVALRELIIKKYGIQNTIVIPNVVNTSIFKPGKNLPGEKISFIHISTMIYQKNPEAILKALSLVKAEIDFEASFFGPIHTEVAALVKEYGLQDRVFLKGEVHQAELARALQHADALILYSRFETFGCVLIEANACGVPVIVSELPVFHEIVQEGMNGMFVKGEDPPALAKKLKEFVQQRQTFNKQAISNLAAERYNYGKVGKQFFQLYQAICPNQA